VFLIIKIWQTCKVPCKVLQATPVIARDYDQVLEIHNPKVGSSSLPRAIFCFDLIANASKSQRISMALSLSLNDVGLSFVVSSMIKIG